MKGFLTIILSFFCSAVFADNVLVLNFTSGSTQLYDLHETMKVQTVGDSILVTSKSMSAAYASHMVKSYQFSLVNEEETGINQAVVNGTSAVTFERKGQTLVVSGLQQGARVKVYSTNAMLQNPSVSYGESTAVVDFSSLTTGVYIVQITGCTDAPSMKFTKFE